MNSVTPIINAVTRATLFLMAGLLLIWAMHHETRTVTLGMVLGLTGGLVNFRYLAVKVNKVTEMAANNEMTAASLGFVTRICFAILVTMFSVKIEHFSLEATVAGLFIPQILSIPTGIYLGIRNKL